MHHKARMTNGASLIVKERTQEDSIGHYDTKLCSRKTEERENAHHEAIFTGPFLVVIIFVKVKEHIDTSI